jgi:hypothetical protein
LIRASGDEETLMQAEIDPGFANDKNINPYNDIINDRREDMYGNRT